MKKFGYGRLELRTTDHRPFYHRQQPLTIDNRPLTTDNRHRPLTTDNRPLTTDNRPLTTDYRPFDYSLIDQLTIDYWLLTIDLLTIDYWLSSFQTFFKSIACFVFKYRDQKDRLFKQFFYCTSPLVMPSSGK